MAVAHWGGARVARSRDRRFGRPSGMVVEGTRVDLLPARARWEANAEMFSLYVCGCGFTKKVAFSLTFVRVPHRCRVAV